MRVGAGPGVRLEGWLRWSAHPLSGAVCKVHGQYPAFAPETSELAVGFLLFLYFVYNLPQLHMYSYFTPLYFLCVLLLEEV